MSGGKSIKRFYKEAAARAADGGYAVLLDGRAVKTPGRADLRLPTRALAQEVAAEWARQEDRVRPRTMPLTGLACTAIDLIGTRREQVIDELAEYGGTDVLCYRAEGPAALVARQAAAWQPLLDWAALAFSAPLAVTTGIYSVDQPESALAALRRAVAPHDVMALAALASAARASGSLVIALALSHGRLDPEAAFEAAELDASYQIEAWGEDLEATRRRDLTKADLAAAGRFLALLRA